MARGDAGKKLGQRGEKLAVDYLRRQGYQIRATNVRSALGEIDIIATEANTLVFVEVRTRRGFHFGTPEESVGERKRRKLIELAEEYLQSLGEPAPACRIDVVVVAMSAAGHLERIGVIRDAVRQDSL